MSGKGKGKGKDEEPKPKPKKKVIRRRKPPPPPEPNVYEVAALAVMNADYVLVLAGAGFSADSGLVLDHELTRIPAYRGMKPEELLKETLVKHDVNGFYGYWGWQYNNFLDTPPHSGYDTLFKWKNDLYTGPQAEGRVKPENLDETIKALKQRRKGEEQFGKKKPKRPPPAWKGPFFVATTNIDTAFTRVGFNPKEVSEIHGSVRYWQCTVPCKHPKGVDLWGLDPAFRVEVDLDRMRAPLFKNVTADERREQMEEIMAELNKEPKNLCEVGCTCAVHDKFFELPHQSLERTIERVSAYRKDNQMWVTQGEKQFRQLLAPSRHAKRLPPAGQLPDEQHLLTMMQDDFDHSVRFSRASTPAMDELEDMGDVRADPKQLMHLRPKSPGLARAGAVPKSPRRKGEAIPPPSPSNFHFSGVFGFCDADYYLKRLDNHINKGLAPREHKPPPISPGKYPGEMEVTRVVHHDDRFVHDLIIDDEPTDQATRTLRELQERERERPSRGEALMASRMRKSIEVDSPRRPGTRGGRSPGAGGAAAGGIDPVNPEYVPGSLYFPQEHFSSYLNASGVEMTREDAPDPPILPPDPVRNQPKCHNDKCKAPARPNVLMHGDENFKKPPSEILYRKFIRNVKNTIKAAEGSQDAKILKVTILELGCGPGNPLRRTGESLAEALGPEHCHFVRVNPEHYQVPESIAEFSTILRDRGQPAIRKMNEFVESTTNHIEEAIKKVTK